MHDFQNTLLVNTRLTRITYLVTYLGQLALLSSPQERNLVTVLKSTSTLILQISKCNTGHFPDENTRMAGTTTTLH